jgi:hypothetical protein
MQLTLSDGDKTRTFASGSVVHMYRDDYRGYIVLANGGGEMVLDEDRYEEVWALCFGERVLPEGSPSYWRTRP